MKTQNHPLPTAAEARARILEWHDLPPQRRAAITSALSLLCRIGGKRPPATVRLDPTTCLPAIDHASPIALGITPKTHQNHRAALRYILRRLGLLAPAHNREPVTDPAWANLVDALPARFHPHRLRAFMRYCAGQSIPPDAVSNATLAAYLRYREETRGGPNVRSDVREVARQWNKMVQHIQGWPRCELGLAAPEGRARTLPFTNYPESLQADVEAYLAWLVRSPEDAIDLDDVAHEPASSATVGSRRTGIRLLLWGAMETGREPETLTSLADLVGFDVARMSLRWHRQRLGKPDPSRPSQILPTGGTALLADTLQSLSRYCKLEGEPLVKLRRMLAIHRPKPQREITEALAALLDQLSVPDVEAKLLHLPSVLMAKARLLRTGWTTRSGKNHPPKPNEACWIAALGAAIEIELHLPLRIHDLTHLRLEQDVFVTPSPGRKPSEVRLRVTANKNGRVVESWLRGASASLLLEYLHDFRSLGPHPETAWVFPNRDGTARPRAKGGFGEAIADVIHEHTGVRVNVHAFRAFAATIILADNPHAIEDVRALLGHATFEMAMRHYYRVNREGAAQRLSDAISRRRARTRMTTAPPRLPLGLGEKPRRRA